MIRFDSQLTSFQFRFSGIPALRKHVSKGHKAKVVDESHGAQGLNEILESISKFHPYSILDRMLIDSEFFEQLVNYQPGDDVPAAPIAPTKVKKSSKPKLPLKRDGIVIDPSPIQSRLLIDSAP